MTESRNVQIENVGPIDRLSIPLPEAGIVVLRGRNGIGKSHALAAVDALVGGRGKPPCKDFADKAVVHGLGATLTIGRSARRTGEAEVLTLEGRLDISQLVQPPIKDVEAADRTRVKALIQLCGASAEADAFSRILPNGVKLGELLGPGDLADDPVNVAGKVKRALEALARQHERASQDAAAKAAALAEQCGSLGPGESGLSRLETEQALQAALVAQKEVESKADEAVRRRQQAQDAQQKIQALRQATPASQTVEALAAEELAVADEIQRLQEALAAAQARRQGIRRQLEQQRVIQAQVEELERLLADVPDEVPASALESAAAAVEQARQQHARAIEVERLKQLTEQAERLRRQAEQESDAATRLRDAAQATDDVLTQLVSRATHRLRVQGGRLVCDTERGIEPFAELSSGERWRIALEVAAEHVGRGGLIVVPQEAWESLDPIHRNEVASIAVQVGVVILTAEADERGEIGAEIITNSQTGEEKAEAKNEA